MYITNKSCFPVLFFFVYYNFCSKCFQDLMTLVYQQGTKLEEFSKAFKEQSTVNEQLRQDNRVSKMNRIEFNEGSY